MRERLSTKGPVKNDLSYFWAIINNQISQFYRDRKNGKENPLGILRNLTRPAENDDEQPTAAWSASKQLMLCPADHAIQELSAPDRAVYELAVIAWMEPADIAQMLDKKPGTVRLTCPRRKNRLMHGPTSY